MTIHSFKFSNLFSFEEETEVSFVLDKRAAASEIFFDSSLSDERISKVLAVVGANGSGKTNLIKPLAYLLWFISDSFFGGRDADRLFIKPHMLSESTLTDFHLEFEADGVRYKYLMLRSAERVYFEALSKKTSRLWSKIFTRKWLTESEKYEVTRKGFGSAQMPLEDADQNISLISLAAQYKSKTAVSICTTLRARSTNVSSFGRDNIDTHDIFEVSSFYRQNEKNKNEMVNFLREQDFGVEDIEIQVYDQTQDDGTTKERHLPWVIHKQGDREFQLPLIYESSGTQAAYYLMSKIFPLLERGGIMIYDELEGDLHPLMIEPILNLFISPRTNPHNAQIIFTSHSIEVLNLLQKNQIVLVEKTNAASQAWKLSDMEGVRSDDNFYAKYMSGAYGAIPRV